jgi:hypothetical protein
MRKGTVIVIAVLCIFGGAHTSVTGQSRSGCEALGHFSRTCHCQPNYDDFARYRAGLFGPFEIEYDVEKWEKALRQGLGTQSRENFRIEGPDIPCRKPGVTVGTAAHSNTCAAQQHPIDARHVVDKLNVHDLERSSCHGWSR